jgi:hypothetical protein
VTLKVHSLTPLLISHAARHGLSEVCALDLAARASARMNDGNFIVYSIIVAMYFNAKASLKFMTTPIASGDY